VTPRIQDYTLEAASLYCSMVSIRKNCAGLLACLRRRQWIGGDLEGRNHDHIEVMSLNFSVETEENHAMSQDNRRRNDNRTDHF
jgi:hypothetical protein